MTSRKNNETNANATYEWLMARNAQGHKRIDRLSFGRLASIYHSRKATSQIRRAIERAARRCGYRPAIVLGLIAWN